MTNTTLSQDELAEMIVLESRKYSISHTAGTRYDATEVASYLGEKVWLAIRNKPTYHNIQGVRKAIKTRGYNYFNKEKKHNIVSPFSAFERKEKVGVYKGEYNFESRFNDGSKALEDEFFENRNITELLETLPARQRLVLELTNGILNGLTDSQMVIAKEIVIDKAKCKQGHIGKECKCKFELTLTIKDIARIIGCSPRTVDYDLKRVQEGV